MSEGEILEKGKKNKASLQSSTFKQQTLSAWRPNPTMVTTLITFLIFGIIFLGLGILLVQLANNIVEKEVEYHVDWKNVPDCRVPFEITKTMKQPVYIYYELDNLYQNHRRYVKSRDNSQLKGNIKDANDLSSCDPIQTIKDLGINKALDGTELDDDAPANPCGLIAKSFFNDTYEIYDPKGKNITVNDKGIAWDTDVKDLFKNAEGYESIQYRNVEDEHFIVWMRVAGFADFKKLWGKIEDDLEPGTYSLRVFNNYDVSSFKGKKKFFLTTTASYGGKNTFLAIWYLVVGSLWLVFAGIFFFAHLRQRKRIKSE